MMEEEIESEIVSKTQTLCWEFQQKLVEYCAGSPNVAYMLDLRSQEPYSVRPASTARAKYHRIGSLHALLGADPVDKAKGWRFYTIALVNRKTGDVHGCQCALSASAGPVTGNVANLDTLRRYMTPFGLYK